MITLNHHTSQKSPIAISLLRWIQSRSALSCMKHSNQKRPSSKASTTTTMDSEKPDGHSFFLPLTFELDTIQYNPTSQQPASNS